MRTVRLCKTEHFKLDGQGAAIHGGRWNSAGIPAVYMSSTRSLALLEILANFGSIDELSGDFSLKFVYVLASVPDSIVRFETPWWSSASRPHWARRSRSQTQAVGDAWLRDHPDLALAVPSVLVPEEDNFLLHPSLVESGVVTVDEVSPMFLDPRLLRRL